MIINIVKKLRKNKNIIIITEKITYLWFLFWHICFYFCKVKSNKIVISNYYGKGYGDNLKYIADRLLCGKNSKIDIVWIVDNLNCNLPDRIRKRKKYSIKSIYEFMTARIWIDNCRKYYFYNILKKTNTIYIQTWHAGVGLKRSEQDVEKELNKNYVLSAKKDSKLMDYILSGSDWQTQYFKKYFWIDERKTEILKFGLPRNDIFFNLQSDYRDKVISFYKLKNDTKIVLVAPTFRKNNNLDNIIDFDNLLYSLKNKFGSNWIVFLRLHPNIRNYSINLPLNIINVSYYEDVQELLYASDILITDYSSIMFDMLLLEKPVFIFAKDIYEYSKERNYTFKFCELPFSLAKNDIELSENINNYDEMKYRNKILDFKKKLGSYEDGHACERVCKLIEDIIDGKVQK